MLKRWMQVLGVDYDQWRSLVVVSIKVDFRVSGGAAFGNRGSKSRHGALFSLLIFYLITGIFFAALALFNKDVFLTGTIFLTYAIVMIGALVLIEYHAIVISPDDYAILGYQPVSSRTYFAAKLANALFYTSLLTTALGLPAIGAYLFTLGFRPLLGIAAAAATYLSTITTTLAMVVLYAGVVRHVHPKRLNRALSYLQLVLSFLIYGGYVFIPEFVNKEALAGMRLSKSPWLMLHPATWFASYLELATGRWGMAQVLPALASLVALGLLLRYASGRLSLEYSERLAALSSTSEEHKATRAAPRRAALFFKRDEGRAVALLIRAQFKHDQKFRLAVLGILPLTLFYLFLSLRDGPFPDPFVHPSLDFGRAGLLYLAILLFPVMLKTTLVNSDSYQAAWIFFATPADKARLVLSMKDFVMVYFVAPYILFVGAIFIYFFQNLLHVFLHLIVLFLLAHILLQLAVLVHPDLPFSQPVRKGERSSRLMFVVVLAPIAAMGLLPVLFILVYPRPFVFAASLVAFALLTAFLEKTVGARVQRVTQRLQFQS